jgi:hypothetical protein
MSPSRSGHLGRFCAIRTDSLAHPAVAVLFSGGLVVCAGNPSRRDALELVRACPFQPGILAYAEGWNEVLAQIYGAKLQETVGCSFPFESLGASRILDIRGRLQWSCYPDQRRRPWGITQQATWGAPRQKCRRVYRQVLRISLSVGRGNTGWGFRLDTIVATDGRAAQARICCPCQCGFHDQVYGAWQDHTLGCGKRNLARHLGFEDMMEYKALELWP